MDDFADDASTTGRLQIGGVVRGFLDDRNDEDWFAVELTEGEVYTFGIEPDLGAEIPQDDGDLGIWDDSGNLLELYNNAFYEVTEGGNAGAFGLAISNFTPSYTGTHYVSALTVFSAADAGAYLLRADLYPDTIPGDSTSPVRLEIGESFASDLPDGGDFDWIGVELEAGHPYRVTLETDPEPYDPPGVSLRDPEGNYLNFNSAYDPLLGVTTSGLYFLEVGDYNGSGYDYTLTIEAAEPDPIPADTSTEATLAPGAPAAGEIEFTGDRDWFAVTLDAGTAYSFELLLDDYDGAILALRDDAGALIETTGETPGYSQRARIDVFTPETSGTYYLDVAAFEPFILPLSYDLTATLVGAQILTGTEGPDTLAGGDGTDTVRGLGGDDVLSGGDRGDLIEGGAGFDTITGDGEDYTSAGDDTIFGGPGRDVIRGVSGDNLIDGGGWSDLIEGGYGDDTLLGGGGDDGIKGLEGDDSIDGGAGADRLSGSWGDDTIVGGTGDDVIGAGGGRDIVEAGAGNDLVGGGYDDDMLRLGDGDDGGFAGGGDDTLEGGAGDDRLSGGPGDDSVDGGTGHDEIGGGYGADTIIGGDGDDDVGGGAGDDFLRLGDGDDTGTGGLGDDRVEGGAGDDSLSGGLEGADTLVGGTGDDTLNGGRDDGTRDPYSDDEPAFADVFLFETLRDGEVDVIENFQDGFDRIHLSLGDTAPGDVTIADTDAGTEISAAGHRILVSGLDTATITLEDIDFA